MKKKIFTMAFVSLLAAATFCACNKDDDEKETVGTSVLSDELTIEVSDIDDDDNDRIDTVKLVIQSFEDYYPDYSYYTAKYSQSKSKFTLDLSEPVPSKYLTALEDYFDDAPDGIRNGIKISDPNVKMTSVTGLYAYERNSSGYSYSPRVGSFYHGTDVWEGQLAYVNGNVTITGSGSDKEEEGDYTYNYSYKYNMSLKKGWNIIYVTSTRTTKGKVQETTVEATTQAPSGAKWRFSGYY